jgi:hypothetical protein
MPLTNAIFAIDLQDDNKKLTLKKCFSAYYFLKAHFHHFSEIKSPKEVTKLWESWFFLLFLLDDRRIIEGSGSIPLTNGSGRPKTCGSGACGSGGSGSGII